MLYGRIDICPTCGGEDRIMSSDTLFYTEGHDDVSVKCSCGYCGVEWLVKGKAESEDLLDTDPIYKVVSSWDLNKLEEDVNKLVDKYDVYGQLTIGVPKINHHTPFCYHQVMIKKKIDKDDEVIKHCDQILKNKKDLSRGKETSKETIKRLFREPTAMPILKDKDILNITNAANQDLLLANIKEEQVNDINQEESIQYASDPDYKYPPCGIEKENT